MGGAHKSVLAVMVVALLILPYAYGDAAESTRAIRELDTKISELEEQGMPIVRLRDTLDEMRALHTMEQYDTVMLRDAEAAQMIAELQAISAEIDQAERLLAYAEANGKYTADARAAFEAAKREYSRGNTAQAANRTAETKDILAAMLAPDIEEIHNQALALEQALRSDPLIAPMADGTLDAILRAYDSGDRVAFLMLAGELARINSTAHDILSISDRMRSLQQQNHSVTRIEDMIAELMGLQAQGSMDRFSERLDETDAMIASISIIAENISRTEGEVSELSARGIGIGRAGELIALSREEFSLENYESANEYERRAAEIVERARQENVLSALVAKARADTGAAAYIREHIIILLIAAALLVLIGKVVWDYARCLLLRRRIGALKREDIARTKILIALQEQYYKYHRIDKQTYTAGFSEYTVRQDTIRELIPRLEKMEKELRSRPHIALIDRMSRQGSHR